MIKEKIKEALAQLEFIKQNKGLKVDIVNIAEIPKTWEFFNNTTDLWRLVDYDEEDLTGCLYKPQMENIFKAHVHEHSDEMMTPLVPGTSFAVYTPKWNKEIKYGESIFIPRGLPHLVKWNNENMIMNIFWHPAMNGWEAKFLKK